MEVDWTIGMDAYWLFILILPFITNYIAGVVYGSISALSGLLLSIVLFDTPLIGYLQPYGQNMVDWFPIIYVVVMIAAAIMEYELTSYQIEKKISDEKIAFYQAERTKRLREQLSIYESNELTIRKYKHDIRHFNRVLSGFIDDGEYEKASNYLREFDSMLEQVTTVSFCDNKVVNELLTIYAARCQKLGFKLRAKAAVPERFAMEEVELTSLLANALENALESQDKAPKEKRFISVDINYDGRKLRLQTKNYCPEKITFNDEGMPVSTKIVQSGIGTQQIRAIAQKYSGIASFKLEGDVFVVKAVMTCL
jgi:sensor histidine kinase regulating citrate/malate metabolism